MAGTGGASNYVQFGVNTTLPHHDAHRAHGEALEGYDW